MPLKVGTANVIRLFKRETSFGDAVWMFNNYGSCPTTALQIDFNPEGSPCSTIGEYVYSNDYGGMCFVCNPIEQIVDTEVTHLKTATQDIHKRVTITFSANGGYGGSSQTRTWGVENVTQPTNPTRSSYTFKGWATTISASTPNVSFPFLAPQNNTTYYAVWEASTPQTSTPMLIDETGIRTTVRYSVRNNDTSSATIYSDVSTTPPTTSRGVIASGAKTTIINTGIPIELSGTVIYARAQASGKTMSAITSLYRG